MPTLEKSAYETMVDYASHKLAHHKPRITPFAAPLSPQTPLIEETMGMAATRNYVDRRVVLEGREINQSDFPFILYFLSSQSLDHTATDSSDIPIDGIRSKHHAYVTLMRQQIGRTILSAAKNEGCESIQIKKPSKLEQAHTEELLSEQGWSLVAIMDEDTLQNQYFLYTTEDLEHPEVRDKFKRRTPTHRTDITRLVNNNEDFVKDLVQEYHDIQAYDSFFQLLSDADLNHYLDFLKAQKTWGQYCTDDIPRALHILAEAENKALMDQVANFILLLQNLSLAHEIDQTVLRKITKVNEIARRQLRFLLKGERVHVIDYLSQYVLPFVELSPSERAKYEKLQTMLKATGTKITSQRIKVKPFSKAEAAIFIAPPDQVVGSDNFYADHQMVKTKVQEIWNKYPASDTNGDKKYMTKILLTLVYAAVADGQINIRTEEEIVLFDNILAGVSADDLIFLSTLIYGVSPTTTATMRIIAKEPKDSKDIVEDDENDDDD